MSSLLRIVEASPVGQHKARLILTNGEERVVDLEHLLSGPALEQIREDPEYFKLLFVEAGTLSWPNGIQLCPDSLIYTPEEWAEIRARRPGASPLERIKKLIAKLHTLDDNSPEAKPEAKPEANRVRQEMEADWDDLTEEEKDEAGRYSAELYRQDETDRG